MAAKKVSAAKRVSASEDVLTEILRRLPLKSLAKFRCASKHWLSLINGPNLSHRRYPNPNSDPPTALLLQPTNPLPQPPWAAGPRVHPQILFVRIIGTANSAAAGPNSLLDRTTISLSSVNHSSSSHVCICNSCSGLLLCHDDTTLTRANNFFVVNPTTRKSKTLPPIKFELLEDHMSFVYHVAGMSLATDPVLSKSSDHQFKVVCAIMISYNLVYWPAPCTTLPVYQILIYSSATKEWKLSGSSFALTGEESVKFDRSVLCKGAIHWYSSSQKSLYFDIQSESLRNMDMPPEILSTRYFGTSRGHLHIIDNDSEHDRTNFKLYEMKSDYSGWVLKQGIQLGGLIDKLSPLFLYSDYLTVLCFVPGGDKEEDDDDEEFMVLQISNYNVRYNLKNGSFYVICRLPVVIPEDSQFLISYGRGEAFPYFESLANCD